MQVFHPLNDLSVAETKRARDIVLSLHPQAVISFREIFLQEPKKQELKQYLDAEHSAKPARKIHRSALAQYDVITSDRIPDFYESIIDIEEGRCISQRIVDKKHHAALTISEFDKLVEACNSSKLFQDAVAELKLPEGFEVLVEPWPYGGLLPDDENRRYFQGLCFAQKSDDPDRNFYSYPIPIIPVMDYAKQEVIRIDRLATGGREDGLGKPNQKCKPDVVNHCVDSEYVPQLRPHGTRSDLKPYNVLQPEGPSFKAEGTLVQWQGWRFRLGFNPREGAVLHDMRFQGRSVMYRLSFSEMTVPYADARWPFVRKQAFDFGDGGAGKFANSLHLGCDCLGVIKYFDGVTTDPSGEASVQPNVVCMHEQDNGIGWKHTNWRTGTPVVARSRELVVQFIITLANYEYIFAYKLDQAGGITLETRATGIVNVVNIDPGKVSDYGTVVSPGALAQNHQHIFAFRMDFAVDGHENTVVVEESHAVPQNEKTNPYGNYYEIVNKKVDKSCWIDACAEKNRIIKVLNQSKVNPVSKQPVGYKFTPMATQLLLAAEGTPQERRAKFAKHHVWVTKHKDGEFYAGGRYTLQSKDEIGGVSDAVARQDDVADEDVVVWNVFGLTHNPRCEDWPVMPVEIHQLHIKPVNFFTENPSIDVPSNMNRTSKLATEFGNVKHDQACCKPNL